MLEYLQKNPLDFTAWLAYRDYILETYSKSELNPNSILYKIVNTGRVPANPTILLKDVFVNPKCLYLPEKPYDDTIRPLSFFKEVRRDVNSYEDSQSYLEAYGISFIEVEEIPDVVNYTPGTYNTTPNQLYYGVSVSCVKDSNFVTFDCDSEEQMQEVRAKLSGNPEGYLIYVSSPGKYWIITGLMVNRLNIRNIFSGPLGKWGDIRYQSCSAKRCMYVLRAFIKNGFVPKEVEYKAGNAYLTSFRNQFAEHWHSREQKHANIKH